MNSITDICLGWRTPSVFTIALEGSNGVGKTTLAKKLCDIFNVEYLPGIPSSYVSNKSLVSSIFKIKNFEVVMLYYLSGVLMQDEIVSSRNPNLAILDRSIFSTLAYHFAMEGQSRLDLIGKIIQILPQKPILPNLIIYLAASKETIKNRLSSRIYLSQSDYEMMSDCIFSREQLFYKTLSTELNYNKHGSCVVVNTDNLNSEQVFNYVHAIIKQYYKG